MKPRCDYCNHMPKCGFNGIDRRDNTDCYRIGNVDTCCEWCNQAKGTSDPVSFLEQCMHIVHYLQTGELLYPESFGKPGSPSRLSNCRWRDKKRNLECTLIQEDIDRILTQTCVQSGLPATSADRIDNSKGHTREKIQPTISACNIMRNDRTNEEFRKHMNDIVRHATETGLLEKMKALNIPRLREKKASMGRNAPSTSSDSDSN